MHRGGEQARLATGLDYVADQVKRAGYLRNMRDESIRRTRIDYANITGLTHPRRVFVFSTANMRCH